MNIVPATPHDINQWHAAFLDACTDRQQWVQVVTGLGGDRLYAIQDGGGFFAKDGDEIIGVVSYSPTGEYNKPHIVGLWVKDNNATVAAEIIRHAIAALSPGLQVGEKILVDVFYPVEHAAYTEEVLGKDYYDKLDPRRHSLLL